MNTPDAGLIRVRWYALPAEPEDGTYELTDYSSSNYDPSPHSYDPPIGEESTSRVPFDDYRDCCPPPWPSPSLTDCANAAGPCFARYNVPALTWSSNVFNDTLVPKQSLPAFRPCGWRLLNILAGGVFFDYLLVINADASVTFAATARPPFSPHRAAVYDSKGAVDPGGPFKVHLRSGLPPSLIGPTVIRFTGSDPDVLGIDRCTGLGILPSTFLEAS